MSKSNVDDKTGDPDKSLKKSSGKQPISNTVTRKKTITPNKLTHLNLSQSIKAERPKRSFPVLSLEEALKIPQSIRKTNNGRPMDPKLVAKATCGTSPKAKKFFYLTAASRDYGLTSRTPNTHQIALTDLGREILFASSSEREKELKIEAFFNVDKFKQTYDYYEGSILPEEQYLTNVLETIR